ncbi:MAG: Gfo/Idh/MocA family oxidoreductase [Thiohalomonadaceae bacterium]
MSEPCLPQPERRRLLQGLVGMPVLAVFGAGVVDSRHAAGVVGELPAAPHLDIATPPLPTLTGEPLRLGMIGVGRRGRALLSHCLHGELNVAVTAICDVFDVHADAALAQARRAGHRPRRARSHHDVVEGADVDAVIVATPDHWHAPMVLAALEAGKHVYVERCLAHRLRETLALYDAALKSPAVIQVGHQHRQTEAFFAARAAVRDGLLGHVSLVQASAHQAGTLGPWQAPPHPEANPQTVDWRQFLGNAPSMLFDAEHVFRWRRWWAYGAGLASAALTRDFDRLNGVLDLGIPRAVVASGGIYTHHDGREVPDVLHVSMEFPEHKIAGEEGAGLALVYGAALVGDYAHEASLVGSDATLHWNSTLTLRPHAHAAALSPAEPRLLYAPRASASNSPVNAAAQYTWREGRLYDATYLHMREWLGCVRHGGTPSCDVERGFAEAVTAQMATLAYRLGRRIEWDAERRRLGNVTRQELEALRMA